MKIRIFKRIAAFAAVLCAVAALIPMPVQAEAEKRPLYFYNGVLTYMEYDESGVHFIEAADLPGWSSSGNVLTLENFYYKTQNKYALFLTEDTTLVLKGTNTLALGNARNPASILTCIEKLTIKGPGTLNIVSDYLTVDSKGISASALLIEEGAKVNVSLNSGDRFESGYIFESFMNSMGVYSSRSLTISDNSELRVQNNGGGVGVCAGTLEMFGGLLQAVSVTSETGIKGCGLSLRSVGTFVRGAVVYAKGGKLAVSITNEPSTELAVLSAGGAGSGYTIRAGFTNRDIYGAQNAFFRAVPTDVNGEPNFYENVYDAKILVHEYSTLMDVYNAQGTPFDQNILYVDENGDIVGSQVITVERGGVSISSALKAPAGYRIKDSSNVNATDTGTPVVVQVRLFADERQYKNIDYIDGYVDGLFRPDSPITRAEVASIFYKLFAEAGYIPDSRFLAKYSDLNSAHWAYDRIAYAVENGIMQGYPGEMFGPNVNMSRAEMVVVLYNLNIAPLDDTLTPVPISDISGHWAKGIIDIMSANGVLDIYKQTFVPDIRISRAEAVLLINTYLKRSDTWNGGKTFSDVPAESRYYAAIMNAANGTI